MELWQQWDGPMRDLTAEDIAYVYMYVCVCVCVCVYGAVAAVGWAYARFDR